MLALKLKLDPTSEQMVILDKMFWKWASICSRISAGQATQEELAPPENANGIWFSKTQLNQANTDVKDLVLALKKSAEQKKRSLRRDEKRATEIREAIDNPEKRDINPARTSTFRIKEWVQKTGNLAQKYHTLKKWKGELKKLEKAIQKRKQTIETIERGRIRFKPTRITLHKNSFLVSFGKKFVMLKPFAKGTQPNLEIKLVTEPIQATTGSKGGLSSARSKEFLRRGMVNFISFALDKLFFGMNDAEKMLLKAKKPDKVLKKEQKVAKKKEKFKTKASELKKMLGRDLTPSEEQVLSQENEKFFADVSAYSPSNKYKELLQQLALELFNRNEYFNPQKYVILVRKPINRFKTKKLSNLHPEDWEYFLQVSYEPFAPEQITAKTVMGIDRGIKHLLAIAIFNPKTKTFVFNKLVENPVLGWKERLKRLRKAIQKLERRTRANTGRHIPENQLKKRLRSIENRVNNLYHNLSAEIVKIAKENQSAIVFESLERRDMKQHGRSKGKRMKALNYFLSNFDYGKIASLIKYKADKEGIPVFDILPAYTSQNCAKCLIESENLDDSEGNYCRDKENSKIGYCKKHGYIDADLNAARTIAVCYSKGLNAPMPFGSRK
jgi:IS605 OrfB family transposase